MVRDGCFRRAVQAFSQQVGWVGWVLAPLPSVSTLSCASLRGGVCGFRTDSGGWVTLLFAESKNGNLLLFLCTTKKKKKVKRPLFLLNWLWAMVSCRDLNNTGNYEINTTLAYLQGSSPLCRRCCGQLVCAWGPLGACACVRLHIFYLFKALFSLSLCACTMPAHLWTCTLSCKVLNRCHLLCLKCLFFTDLSYLIISWAMMGWCNCHSCKIQLLFMRSSGTFLLPPLLWVGCWLPTPTISVSRQNISVIHWVLIEVKS